MIIKGLSLIIVIHEKLDFYCVAEIKICYAFFNDIFLPESVLNQNAACKIRDRMRFIVDILIKNV